MARVVRDQAEFKGQGAIGAAGRGPEGSLAGQYASEAAAVAGLASALDRQADLQAARDGADAGALAGMDGRPEISGRTSVYGAQFERAALTTYANRLDTKVREGVNAVADAHGGDPVALAQGLADLKKQMLADDVIAQPLPRAAFEQQFERLRVPVMRSAAREAERQFRRAGAETAATTLDAGLVSLRRQAYGLGLDEDGLKATADEQKKLDDIVTRNVAAGFISPGAGEKIRSGIASERVAGHLQGAFSRLPDPDAQDDFLDRMRDDFRAGRGIAKDMPQKDFARLYAGLERERRDADRAAQRAERQRRAGVERDGERLLADGKLDRQWLDDHAEDLGMGTYRRFSRAVGSRVAGEVDAPGYGTLMAQANEDPAGARRAALDAFQADRLDRDTYDRVLKRSDRAQAEADDGRTFPREIRSDMLKRLRPADGQDPVQARRQLDATFAFDAWLDANPNAGPEEARTAADELVERYRGAAARNERADLPLPRYAAMPRDRLSLPDLATAAQRLRDAVSSGQVTREEAAREVAVLQRWKGLLERDPGKGGK